MMTKKISAFLFALLFIGSLSVPYTFAQANFSDVLEDIKEGVEGPTGRTDEEGKEIVIDVIDFSESRPWGNLPEEIKTILEAQPFQKIDESGTYENLNDIARDAGYRQALGNAQDLISLLAGIEGLYAVDEEGLPFTDSAGNPALNDNGNFVVQEIRFKGESQIRSVILTVVKVMRNLVAGLAIIWIIISGIQMVLAEGEESKITEQKRSITYAVIGLIIILLLERMIVLLYGVPGIERGLDVSGPGISQEMVGLISFAKALIGAVAILMIILSGIKTIAAQGEEDQLTAQKKSILWVIVGIVVILVNEVVVENLYIEPALRQLQTEGAEAITESNVQNIINLIGTIAQFLIGFVGLVAFGILIYGAGSMITNFGNDEEVEKAKKIIKNALIGIVVIISAFALVSTVIKFQ